MTRKSSFIRAIYCNPHQLSLKPDRTESAKSCHMGRNKETHGADRDFLLIKSGVRTQKAVRAFSEAGNQMPQSVMRVRSNSKNT